MSIKHKLTYEELARNYAQEMRQHNQARGIEETLDYIKDYADAFVLEDEEVTQSISHLAAIKYLVAVLEWLFHDQNVGMPEDFMFYLPDDEDSKISPDVAVVDGLLVSTSNPQISYQVGIDGPPPRVAFEFASKNTWNTDFDAKTRKYANMGVREYFVFDPNPQQVWQGEWLRRGRLVGWSLDLNTNSYVELEKDSEGRLSSTELKSLLKPEVEISTDDAETITTTWLRIYDLQGNLRLTEVEAAQKHIESERELRLQEQQRVESERELRLQEQQRTKAEQERAESERQRAEQAETALVVERRRVQELETLLRQLKQQP